MQPSSEAASEASTAAPTSPPARTAVAVNALSPEKIAAAFNHALHELPRGPTGTPTCLPSREVGPALVSLGLPAAAVASAARTLAEHDVAGTGPVDAESFARIAVAAASAAPSPGGALSSLLAASGPSAAVRSPTPASSGNGGGSGVQATSPSPLTTLAAAAAAALLHGDEAPDPQVEDFLRVLEEYRARCEAEGRYDEAGRAESEGAVVRAAEEARCTRALQTRHAAERAAAADAHAAQLREFSAAWDVYLADFDAMSATYIAQVKVRDDGGALCICWNSKKSSCAKRHFSLPPHRSLAPVSLIHFSFHLPRRSATQRDSASTKTARTATCFLGLSSFHANS